MIGCVRHDIAGSKLILKDEFKKTWNRIGKGYTRAIFYELTYGFLEFALFYGQVVLVFF